MEPGTAAPPAPTDFHKPVRFDSYVNEHHQCGFCGKGVNAYYYCVKCFPDGSPMHTFCNSRYKKIGR